MRAVTWHGKRDVRVETVPDPVLVDATDAIIRVTSAGLCGSDLHLYELMGPFMEPGDILGHEAIGVVEELGADVPGLAVGDRVVVPFNIACGDCFMCRRGLQSQCEVTQMRETDKGASLFGYTRLYGGVPGAQAQYLRVPQAHYGPIQVPHGPVDDRFLYLSDVLPTAWQAVDYAAIPRGGSVAVLGLGPIGEMCCRVALHQGVGTVIALEYVPERLERARALGVHVIDLREVDDPLGAVRELTDGRGPDSVIDAVGMEAEGAPGTKLMHQATGLLPRGIAAAFMERAGVDRLTALHLGIELVRRGGTLSVIGVYSGTVDPMPMMAMFDKQIQVRMGQANVRRWTDDILPLLTDIDVLGVDGFATHHVGLGTAPDSYAMFQSKTDGVVKVVFDPWADEGPEKARGDAA